MQRTILVGTLLGVAAFLHFFFCNWVFSPFTLDSTVNGGGILTIVRFGSNSGILARSQSSVSVDAIAGFAVPLLMAGGALYVAAGGRRSD